MHCPIYIGSICILLEDLGFIPREADAQIKPMTYCRLHSVHNKVFADINFYFMVEFILDTKQIMLDRWSINEKRQLYIADEGIDIDICDPECFPKVSKFVKESIVIAKSGPLEFD